MKILYPNALPKAFTLSYDDGIEQDIRMIELLDKYNIKGTFNVSFGLLFEDVPWETEGVVVKRLHPSVVKDVYINHEVASHALTHPNLVALSKNQMRFEIATNKYCLERLIGQEVPGLAFPFGGHDDKVAEVLQEYNHIYGRTVLDTNSFALPENFLFWHPTAHHNSKHLNRLIDEFLTKHIESGALFYLWGHSYEFDVDDNWDHLEDILKKVSNHDDVYYATNSEIASYIIAFREMEKASSNSILRNPTDITLWCEVEGEVYIIPPQSEIKI